MVPNSVHAITNTFHRHPLVVTGCRRPELLGLVHRALSGGARVSTEEAHDAEVIAVHTGLTITADSAPRRGEHHEVGV